LAAVIGLAAWLGWSVDKVSWELIAYGRLLPLWHGEAHLLYAGEGRNASIAVSDGATARGNST